MKFLSAAVLILWTILPSNVIAQALLPMPPSGHVVWSNWAFDYMVGNENKEGLVIKDVLWKGIKVLHKGSIPVIRVKYRGDGSSIKAGCGPYRDRIHWGNISHFKGQVTDVIARLFEGDILEIAVFAEIGGYDIYQAWYFHPSGRLEPVVHSRGWSCGESTSRKHHKHHAYWRLDFDIEGIANEVWMFRSVSSSILFGFGKLIRETNTFRNVNDSWVAWSVNRPGSTRHVLIRAPSNELRDTVNSPWFRFSSKDMAVRRFHSSEDEAWPFKAHHHLGYIYPLNLEDTDGRDIVFWYVGHLSHNWSQADEDDPHWHSTGLVIDATW